MNSRAKTFKVLAILIVVTTAIIIYQRYNPVGSPLFPKCPFLMATGLKCPGCGSQRAIHHLLNLNVSSAFTENAMLVVFIPYILVGIIFDLIKSSSPLFIKWRKILFGQKAIIIVLVIIILFWVGRNVV